MKNASISKLTLADNVRYLFVASQTETVIILLMNSESIVKVVDDWQHLAVTGYVERFGDQCLVFTCESGYSDSSHTALANITTKVVVRRVDKEFTTYFGNLISDWMNKLLEKIKFYHHL